MPAIDEELPTRLEAIEARLDRLEKLEQQVNRLQIFTLGQQEFEFAGEKYGYRAATGNQAWNNERAVELPIVHRAVADFGEPESIIEVGNVLSHYYPTEHRVLDLNERHSRVTWNEDVRTFRPPDQPKLVVSISTLEHVGHPQDPGGFRAAVDTILSWLAPGGRLLFTAPLGYNPGVSEYLGDPHSEVTSVRALTRFTADNLWHEISLRSVGDVRYGRPFPCANAIVVVDASVG